MAVESSSHCAPDISPAAEAVARARPLADIGVTPRAAVLSLLLAAWFGYIVPVIDLQTLNTKLGAGHLPVGAVAALLFLLCVVNPLLKLVSRRAAFSRNEVLVIYITSLFSTLVPGMGSESFYVAHFIGSFYYSTRENAWLSFLEPYLKPWFTPALDASGHYGAQQNLALSQWYLGNNGAQMFWGVWIVPVAAWGALVFASYIMLGCLSVMLRAQWGEREALAYPLLRLPQELLADVDADNRPLIRRFFSDRLMWIGLAGAFAIQFVNGLHVYFADVPQVSLSLPLGSFFTEPPWNQMAPMALIVWPIFAAITFLLTSEMSFSLWACLWLIQLQYIAAYYLGFPYGLMTPALGHSGDGVARTFTGFQQVGGYLAYAGILMWTARGHLGFVARRAFGRARPSASERDEPMSYPLAFWGFVLSFAFMVAWSCAAGMRLDIAAALWGLYVVTCIVLSRAVIEGGVMFINQGWVPLGAMAQLMGSGPGQWLNPASIVPGAFLQVSFFQDMRGFIMPSFLHGFKLAHDRKIAARRLCALIFGVTFISLVVGLWAKVRMGYIAGGLTLHPWFSIVAAQYPAKNAGTLLGGEAGAGAGNWFWLGIGGAAVMLMVLARSRLSWFPLHPIGYLLALTAPTQRAWFSFFLGWLLKTLIVKFGGHDAYRKVIPVALGVILGECLSFIFWLLIDFWQGRSGHGLLP